jgi:hypothetical protein
LDQTATLTLMVVATRCTDQRLSLIGTSVKQLGFAPAQLVQKPAGLNRQVPGVPALAAALSPATLVSAAPAAAAFAPAAFLPVAFALAVLALAALALAALAAAAFRGSRKALPSGVKVILNLAPVGEAAMNGWPLKKVPLMSLGFIVSAARATVGANAKATAKTAVRKSILLAPRRKLAGEPSTICNCDRENIGLVRRIDPRRSFFQRLRLELNFVLIDHDGEAAQKRHAEQPIDIVAKERRHRNGP